MGGLIGINDSWMNPKYFSSGMTDFNNIVNTGIYPCVGVSSFTNKPNNFSDGLLIVYSNSSNIFQQVISYIGVSQTRIKWGNWTSWKEI